MGIELAHGSDRPRARAVASEQSYVRGLNGVKDFESVELVPWGEMTSLQFISRHRRDHVLRAGAELDTSAVDELCLHWCRLRGIIAPDAGALPTSTD